MKTLKNYIFPNKCVLCRGILPENHIGYLCDKCYPLVLRNNICPRCGRPYKLDEGGCAYCKEQDFPSNRGIRALFPYKEEYRQSVLRWKYRGIRKYAKAYADLFVNDLCLIEELKIEGLIPVPLSPIREKRRGFNQALDLCNEIAALTDVPVYDILKRNKNTKPQAQCTLEQRKHHLKGIIELKDETCPIELRNIALVDDIYTTGATIEACMEAMNKSSFIKHSNLYILVVCVGI